MPRLHEALCQSGTTEGALTAAVVGLVEALVPFPGQELTRQSRSRRTRSLSPRQPGYLPSPPTPLVWRAQEIDYVTAHMKPEGSLGIQLLTLVGPPGTGETRLAIAAAERLAPLYERGVYFIDLRAVRETEGAAAAIAHRVGATYRSSRPTSLDETHKRWLRDRRVLLVLDNFEGALEAADLVEDLLANSEDLRVLATSRAPLRTGREHQYEVRLLQRQTMARVSLLLGCCSLMPYSSSYPGSRRSDPTGSSPTQTHKL